MEYNFVNGSITYGLLLGLVVAMFCMMFCITIYRLRTLITTLRTLKPQDRLPENFFAKIVMSAIENSFIIVAIIVFMVSLHGQNYL